mmetsp:Transcript_7266/g.17607  ORF Transcript_7266/g.17607 Transcript_7266/m.17607 type:complete len:228 (-) Transcript_7266:253-936(-)
MFSFPFVDSTGSYSLCLGASPSFSASSLSSHMVFVSFCLASFPTPSYSGSFSFISVSPARFSSFSTPCSKVGFFGTQVLPRHGIAFSSLYTSAELAARTSWCMARQLCPVGIEFTPPVFSVPVPCAFQPYVSRAPVSNRNTPPASRLSSGVLPGSPPPPKCVGSIFIAWFPSPSEEAASFFAMVVAVSARWSAPPVCFTRSSYHSPTAGGYTSCSDCAQPGGDAPSP